MVHTIVFAPLLENLQLKDKGAHLEVCYTPLRNICTREVGGRHPAFLGLLILCAAAAAAATAGEVLFLVEPPHFFSYEAHASKQAPAQRCRHHPQRHCFCQSGPIPGA
eukprot:1160377-Pelagomonas_calceolata.AAC.3